MAQPKAKKRNEGQRWIIGVPYQWRIRQWGGGGGGGGAVILEGRHILERALPPPPTVPLPSTLHWVWNSGSRHNPHTCFSATVVVKHYGNNLTIKFKRLARPVVAKCFMTASTSIEAMQWNYE